MISFTPLPERAPVTRYIGGWEGPTVGLDAVGKRNVLHCLELNPGRPARSPLPYRLAVLNYAQGLLYLNFNNFLALVRERTIPTERPPLVGK
jgi:hypothetical protein